MVYNLVKVVCRRVARKCNEGAVTGIWGFHPQRSEIFFFFWQKKLNFRSILIKNNAFKTLHRN